MKSRSIIRLALIAGGLGLSAWILIGAPSAPQSLAADTPAVAPSHQVMACYFHRTVRCPTCKRISAYIEESVQTGLAPQVKEGVVKLMMIDFQDPRNQQYTAAYQITAPTLVIMDVHDGKVASWKPAPKVWSLVGNKDEFFKYVQGEIQGYLQGARTASR